MRMFLLHQRIVEKCIGDKNQPIKTGKQQQFWTLTLHTEPQGIKGLKTLICKLQDKAKTSSSASSAHTYSSTSQNHTLPFTITQPTHHPTFNLAKSHLSHTQNIYDHRSKKKFTQIHWRNEESSIERLTKAGLIIVHPLDLLNTELSGKELAGTKIPGDGGGEGLPTPSPPEWFLH